MILTALNDYYERVAKERPDDIPSFGYSFEKIHFCILLDRQGQLIEITDIQSHEGKKARPKILIVPESCKRSGANNYKPFFLWDNTSYVLGADDKKKPQDTLNKFNSFKALIDEQLADTETPALKAVHKFIMSWDPALAPEIANWENIAGKNCVFRLDGELQYAHDDDEAKALWRSLRSPKILGDGLCLVRGEKGPIVDIHPAIKGVAGGQSSGVNIVSFNTGSFESYGKKSGANAPVSDLGAFQYTTALNYLLRHGSRQLVRIGDTSTLFWTEKASPAEDLLAIFSCPPEPETKKEKGKTVPDLSEETKKIYDALKKIRQGKHLTEYDLDASVFCYVLGLAPNAARLGIRFWETGPLSLYLKRIGQHYRDIEIERQYASDAPFPSPNLLLLETAALRKYDNIPHVLNGALQNAIFMGTRYPRALLTAVLQRLHADGKISYLRASLIKGYIVRYFQANPSSKDMEVTVSLNTESTNPAYLLGRLFAVLEKAQLDALGKINSTIKDRYFGAASSHPRTVFPMLLNMAQHHISKAQYGVTSDKKIAEILDKLENYPSVLTLEQQGLFTLGYYHQRNALYQKKMNMQEA